MRILFLTHGFNNLGQSQFVGLAEAGHEASIEFGIADSATVDAVAVSPVLHPGAIPQVCDPSVGWNSRRRAATKMPSTTAKWLKR